MKNVSTWSGMMNTSKRVLWLWEDLIAKHDVLRSFSGTQKQEMDNINIPDTGVHFYIGSLSDNQSGLYDDNFIKDSLDAMLKNLPYDASIYLDMAGSVSILLNTEAPFLNINEQISHVQNIPLTNLLIMIIMLLLKWLLGSKTYLMVYHFNDENLVKNVMIVLFLIS